MNLIMNENRFEYFEVLPSDVREATFNDFLLYGKKRIGLKFLILGYHWPVYQLYKVTGALTGTFMEPFINGHRVFIWK